MSVKEAVFDALVALGDEQEPYDISIAVEKIIGDKISVRNTVIFLTELFEDGRVIITPDEFNNPVYTPVLTDNHFNDALIVNGNQFVCPKCNHLYFAIGRNFEQNEKHRCEYCDYLIVLKGELSISGNCVPWAGLCIYDEIGGKCKDCIEYDAVYQQFDDTG